MKLSRCIVPIVLSCVVLLLFFSDPLSASAIRSASSDLPFTRLEWIHKGTGRLIFSQEDILAFDWEKQMFLLTDNAAMNMALYPVGQIDPFEVRINNDFLYEGAFVSTISSMGYRGPTIWDRNIGGFLIQSPLYQIRNGYPTDLSSHDIRYNETLKRVLDSAGLIQTIDPNNPPAPISCKPFEWLGEKDGLRVWIDAFPNTFIVGKLARFHFRLACSNQYPDGDYVIETRTTLTAGDNQYAQTVHRVFPVSQNYLGAAHPVGFFLHSDTNEGRWNLTKPCPVQLRMDIAIRRVLDATRGLYSEPIETLITKPITIEVLPYPGNQLPSDAEKVIEGFRYALQKQDWQKALTFCSDTIQQNAGIGPLKEFFEKYTPLEQLSGNTEYHISGQSTNAAGQQTGYECFMALSMPEEKPTINWSWRLKKNITNNTWVIHFLMTPIAEQVQSEKIRLLKEQQLSEERECFLQKNLQATLIPLQDEYIVGQPMRFRLEATNSGDSEILLSYFSSAVMVNNPLAIKGANGSEVLYIGGSTQTAGRQEVFKPGEKNILISNYDAATKYLITTAGDYTVRFRGQYQIPPSEPIMIRVKPGKLNLREEITIKILSVLPAGWEFQGATELSPTSKDTNEHLNLMFGANIGGFVGSFVAVIIDPNEDILATYSKRPIEKIGQGPWGCVYMTERKADMFWPNCRQEITKALNLQ